MHTWAVVGQPRGALMGCFLGELGLWQQSTALPPALAPTRGLLVSLGLARMALFVPLAFHGDVPALW